MVLLHRIPTIAILCIFIGAIQQVLHWEAGREDEERNKTLQRNRTYSQKSDVARTNSSMSFFQWHNLFFLVPYEALIILQRAVQERAYQYIWNKYIIFAQKHYNYTTLSQCGLFIHTCVFKNSIVFKDAIFYPLWYDVTQWRRHICKKIFF